MTNMAPGVNRRTQEPCCTGDGCSGPRTDVLLSGESDVSGVLASCEKAAVHHVYTAVRNELFTQCWSSQTSIQSTLRECGLLPSRVHACSVVV